MEELGRAGLFGADKDGRGVAAKGFAAECWAAMVEEAALNEAVGGDGLKGSGADAGRGNSRSVRWASECEGHTVPSTGGCPRGLSIGAAALRCVDQSVLGPRPARARARSGGRVGAGRPGRRPGRFGQLAGGLRGGDRVRFPPPPFHPWRWLQRLMRCLPGRALLRARQGAMGGAMGGGADAQGGAGPSGAEQAELQVPPPTSPSQCLLLPRRRRRRREGAELRVAAVGLRSRLRPGSSRSFRRALGSTVAPATNHQPPATSHSALGPVDRAGSRCAAVRRSMT